MHILTPVTDNCSSWISRRGRMAVEIFSWPSFHDVLIELGAACMLSGHASNWATMPGLPTYWFIWYLSHRQTAMAKANLHIHSLDRIFAVRTWYMNLEEASDKALLSAMHAHLKDQTSRHYKVTFLMRWLNYNLSKVYPTYWFIRVYKRCWLHLEILLETTLRFESH